ncbi:MAG: radical SAM protein [Magnetococcales bacterium]|nr:radical SAM protein [Magnetococcales bacterium]
MRLANTLEKALFGFRLRSSSRFGRLQRRVLPRKALFNVSNLCNANCVFCAYQYSKEPKLFMADDLFEEICRQFIAFRPESWISLTPLVGEPLTDPHLFDKIALAKRLGAERIESYTNAILLKRHHRAILESGLDELCISFPDFDPTEFTLIFRSEKYQQALEGIHSLLALKKQRDHPLGIRINLRSRRPLEQITREPDYLRFVKPFVDTGLATLDTTTAFDNWGGLITQSDLPEGMRLANENPRKRRIPCMRLFKFIALQEGDIKLCGCRFKGSIHDELTIGNIHRQDLAAIWFGEAAFAIRERFRLGLFPEVCVDCSHYIPMRRPYFADPRNTLPERDP